MSVIKYLWKLVHDQQLIICNAALTVIMHLLANLTQISSEDGISLNNLDKSGL
jgi:hypothetical protein